MGGRFPEGKGANFYRPDPGSTVYSVNNWEKEVVFCGWEVGSKVITGGISLKNKYNTNHPLYRAHELFNDFAGRQSWDQMAVLQLDKQKGDFFSFVRGICVVAADGSNTWKKDNSGKHHYIVIKNSAVIEHIGDYIDSLMAGEDISR